MLMHIYFLGIAGKSKDLMMNGGVPSERVCVISCVDFVFCKHVNSISHHGYSVTRFIVSC